MSINLRTSLEVPGNLDAPGVETCEILEGRRGEVDAARGATGAEVDDGGVDELALVWNRNNSQTGVLDPKMGRQGIQCTPMWRQQLDPPAYWSALSATTRSVFWLGAPHAPRPPLGK